MRKVNLTPEKIKTFESALNILNDKYSNYMTLHQILNLLYPQIKSSEENIGSNNIDKIFNVF